MVNLTSQPLYPQGMETWFDGPQSHSA